MRSKLPPSIQQTARNLLSPFRFTFAVPEPAAINLIRVPGEPFASAKERAQPTIEELCQLDCLRRATFVACTQKYLDLDDNKRRRLIQRPMSVNDCVKLATDQLCKPFEGSNPIFAQQSFLIPGGNAHELVPARTGLPFNTDEIVNVLRASEDENGRLVAKIRTSQRRKRRSATYDIGNASQRVEFQAFNHLMYAVQIANFLAHPRTRDWMNTQSAPDYNGPHAYYATNEFQVGVVYVANLAPKALSYFTWMQLRGGRLALELIW